MIVPHPLHTAKGAAFTELVIEVFRLNGALLSAGDALARPLGLSSARWQVLGAVAFAAPPQPVAGLAREMGLTRQAVQRVVDELAAEGLVRFEENPQHKRAKLVLLTAEGRRIFDAAGERQAPWANALAERAPEKALKNAVQILRSLREELERGEAENRDAS
jgi:DNA-binding MarR family transcriptional regulator